MWRFEDRGPFGVGAPTFGKRDRCARTHLGIGNECGPRRMAQYGDAGDSAQVKRGRMLANGLNYHGAASK